MVDQLQKWIDLKVWPGLFSATSLTVLMLGSNDCALAPDAQHVPVEEFEQNLNRLIQMILDAPCLLDRQPERRILLVTPPPIDADRWHQVLSQIFVAQGRPPLESSNRTMEGLLPYVEVVRRVQHDKVSVLDFFDHMMRCGGNDLKRVSQELLSDGLHMNEAGDAELCKLVLGEVAKLPFCCTEELVQRPYSIDQLSTAFIWDAPTWKQRVTDAATRQ